MLTKLKAAFFSVLCSCVGRLVKAPEFSVMHMTDAMPGKPQFIIENRSNKRLYYMYISVAGQLLMKKQTDSL